MTRKSLSWLLVLYILLCHAPYFIPALNSTSPHLGPIPFTVWYSLGAVNLFGCGLLYYAATRFWKASDEEK